MIKKNVGVQVTEEDLELLQKSAKMQRRSVASILAQGGVELSNKILENKNAKSK